MYKEARAGRLSFPQQSNTPLTLSGHTSWFNFSISAQHWDCLLHTGFGKLFAKQQVQEALEVPGLRAEVKDQGSSIIDSHYYRESVPKSSKCEEASLA